MRRHPDFVLGFARACLAGKLRNSRHVLLRAAREANNPAEAQALTHIAEDLAASLRALSGSPDLDTLRGVEVKPQRIIFQP